MKRIYNCTAGLWIFCLSFAGVVSAENVAVLKPAGFSNDVKLLSGANKVHKQLSPSPKPNRLTANGYIDTLTWRTMSHPTVNFGFLNPGDSLLVWFKPAAACSLISIRFYNINWTGDIVIDIWDGSPYEGNITSLEYGGWIGSFVDSQWVAGNILGHSPLGWSKDDPGHHYWGPYSLTLTEQDSDAWIEIPAFLGPQGRVDLGRNPFYIGMCFFVDTGWGFGAEHTNLLPYHFFKYYAECCGPDGAHDGWFIRSHSPWVEVVVYYPDGHHCFPITLTVLNDTYAPGPFQVSAYYDCQGHADTTYHVNSAFLVYDINGIVDSTAMIESDKKGWFFGQIPILAVDDIVTYYAFVMDNYGMTYHSRSITFSRIQPEHPEADILVVWDYAGDPELDSFFVDLFDLVEKDGEKYEFELWNVTDRNGIDASVVDWGWKTIIVSGWGCVNTLPGREYAGSPFVEWLEAGTTQDPHNLLYLDQDYFCVHAEYDCDWDLELSAGEFMYDYFGVAFAISDNHGAGEGGYDSVAIGEGNFADLRVSFQSDVIYAASGGTADPNNWQWPDWLVELTGDAEQLFHYMDSGFGAGVRLNRGHYKTVFIPWADFFAVDSLENGDLVPKADLVTMFEKILEWFNTKTSVNPTGSAVSTPQSHRLTQNYPNPFNSGTKISYHLAEDSSVELTIYNILGQNIRTLFEGQQAAGSYSVTWDRKDYVGGDVSSGVYFYQLKVEDFVYRKRMLLLK